MHCSGDLVVFVVSKPSASGVAETTNQKIALLGHGINTLRLQVHDTAEVCVGPIERGSPIRTSTVYIRTDFDGV